MQSITLKSHVGSDGILKVHLPDLRDTDIEVVIVYQRSSPKTTEVASLEQFYGICADDPIVIDDQGIAESLDDDLTGAFD